MKNKLTCMNKSPQNNMRTYWRFLSTFLVLLSLLSLNFVVGQNTVFYDNFDRSGYTSPQVGGTPAATYTTGTSPAGALQMRLWSASDYALQINGTGTVGNTYSYIDNSVFNKPYNSSLGLENNSGLITWYFNIRNYGSPSSYKSVIVLATSSSDLNSGTGYAVYYAKTNTGRFSFAKFSGGVQGTVADIIAETGAAEVGTTTNQDFASVKVTFDPSTKNWTLYVRDDGGTAFALPWSGTYTQHGSTASDATYTTASYNLKYSGFYYNGSL